MYIRSLSIFVGAYLCAATCLCVACRHDTLAVRVLPTARIMPHATSHLALATAGTARRAIQPSTPSPLTQVQATVTLAQVTPTMEQSSLAPLDQYRQWIAEAHGLYPFAESENTMWNVMLCESSGNPDSVGGMYYGLFQYSVSTWQGDWNPYRDQSIFDPHAQILATAKAWYDGNQHWWGCYPV